MPRLFVSSVSGLIYSLGIKNFNCSKVFFTEIASSGGKRGAYSFDAQAQMATRICKIESLEIEKISREDFQSKSLNFTSEDFVEIRIFLEAKPRSTLSKPKLLALNPEHLSVHFPIFKLNRHFIKASTEQILYNFLPARAWNFHTIDVKQKRGIIFRSTSINRSQLDSKLANIYSSLSNTMPEVQKEFEIISKAQKTLVVLPLAEHFGGSLTYNQKMFAKISSRLSTTPDLIIIKNHPTDSVNYSDLGQKIFRSSQILGLSSDIFRNIPIEIVVAPLHTFQFAGMFSTAMLGLSSKLEKPTLIYIPKNEKLQEFYLYAQSRQYELIDHELITV